MHVLTSACFILCHSLMDVAVCDWRGRFLQRKASSGAMVQWKPLPVLGYDWSRLKESTAGLILDRFPLVAQAISVNIDTC